MNWYRDTVKGNIISRYKTKYSKLRKSIFLLTFAVDLFPLTSVVEKERFSGKNALGAIPVYRQGMVDIKTYISSHTECVALMTK